MSAFSQFNLTRQFLDAIEEAGYTIPTPIQEKGIPPAMSGQDIIGIAQTGTGKTAAYLLPILQKLNFAQGKAPRALIMVPTKELVVQVLDEAKKFAKHTDLRCVGIYGGVGKTGQVKALQDGVDLLVATPKRLMEHYEDNVLVINSIKFWVLDECDRLLDMGFMPQLELIMDMLPRKKQHLLFSATFSPKVEKLCEDFLEFPIKIEITKEATPAETIFQWYYKVPNRETKINLMEWLLKNTVDFTRVIIFVKTKETAILLEARLRRAYRGLVGVLHSNKDQNTRINSFNAFRDGKLRILIATDVAARGLDVSQVSHVINFDVPMHSEDYVHRIGRTGRANNEGAAISFVNPVEEYHFEKIEQKIRQTVEFQEIPREVKVTETTYEESQEILLEIDARKQKLDPTYKGAFHEKKNIHAQKANRKKGIKLRLSEGHQASTKKKTSKYGRHKN